MRIRTRFILLSLSFAVVTFVVPSARAQGSPPTPPCTDPHARDLDFWLGEWTLTWSAGEGHNSITRRFGDCVIEENFSGELPGRLFEGHSVSVYRPRSGQWRQTWVDNNGSYLAFTGGPDEDGIMRLLGEPSQRPDGSKQLTRMSWVNVEENSLDWHWESSADEGKTWTMRWNIHYERSR